MTLFGQLQQLASYAYAEHVFLLYKLSLSLSFFSPSL